MLLHQVLSGRAEEAVPYASIIYKSLKLLLSFKSHYQTYLFIKEGNHPAASAEFTTQRNIVTVFKSSSSKGN